jgi:beta-carotene ketolase (CrtO type)
VGRRGRQVVAAELHPGTGDSVIGAAATSPQDLIHFSPVHKGNLFDVDMTLSQFGPWRPTPSLAGYKE